MIKIDNVVPRNVLRTITVELQIPGDYNLKQIAERFYRFTIQHVAELPFLESMVLHHDISLVTGAKPLPYQELITSCIVTARLSDRVAKQHMDGDTDTLHYQFLNAIQQMVSAQVFSAEEPILPPLITVDSSPKKSFNLTESEQEVRLCVDAP